MPTSWPVVHALSLYFHAYIAAAAFTHGLSLAQVLLREVLRTIRSIFKEFPPVSPLSTVTEMMDNNHSFIQCL